MAKVGKRYRKLLEMYDPSKAYPLKEAVDIVRKFQSARFTESVELHARLNIDPRKPEQNIRIPVVLPHGTGRKVRVLVLTSDPEKEKEAKEAGADYVGFKDYIEKIKQGWLEFDAVVATPEAMREVGKLGRILGPRGLMPSPKTGTVTQNVGDVVRELKKGRIEIRNDKTGNVHVIIGKTNFTPEQLYENAMTVLEEIARNRPQGVKGSLFKSVYLTTTMGPSVKVDLNDVINELRKRGVKV
ncbi:MAG: 50S ribosomal protein L1 [Thermotogae bacterium]|nr:50S ribosomal protein L1 [Thermotogota bacterium]